MAASFVTPAAFVAIVFVAWYVLLPNASTANASALGILYPVVLNVTLASVALSVGYLVRRRFGYPLRGIFLTCTATSFLVILAIESVWVGPEAFDTTVVSNTALFLFGIFASSAVASIMVAALIAAGAALNRRAMAKEANSPG